jgi:hypothetical protein
MTINDYFDHLPTLVFQCRTGFLALISILLLDSSCLSCLFSTLLVDVLVDENSIPEFLVNDDDKYNDMDSIADDRQHDIKEVGVFCVCVCVCVCFLFSNENIKKFYIFDFG